MCNFMFFCHLLALTYSLNLSNGLELKRFSTKTTYDAAFSPSELTKRNQKLVMQHDTCQAVFVDGTLRHGIRNPGKKDIRRLNNFYERLITETDFENVHGRFKSWSNQFPVATEKHITVSGREEHIRIARRLGLRLKSILQGLDASNVTFMSSETNRTLESCYAFQLGLSNVGYAKLNQSCTIEYDVLRFFDECDMYLAHKNSGVFSKEYNAFKSSDLFKNMINTFKQRNSIPESFEISPGELKSMFVLGASELAAFGSSLWLDILSDDEIQILEYLSDLRSYWKRSYGHRINYEMSCVLLKDVFERMDLLIQDHPEQKRAVFRFAHAETLIPLITVLGLFKDDNVLLGTNFEENKERLFRTSKISPFSSNLVFVLFECSADLSGDTQHGGSESTNQGKPHYMVQVLFNELPIRLPFCESDMCPLAVLKHHLKQHTEECDFEMLCSLPHTHDEL